MNDILPTGYFIVSFSIYPNYESYLYNNCVIIKVQKPIEFYDLIE